jgi:hypothetical protein
VEILFNTFDLFFVQVIEFVQFKDRLQRSMQYLSAKSDSVILHLKQKAESLEEVDVSFPFPLPISSSGIHWLC